LTFLCVVTKELLQKGDSLNQNIQLFQIDFFFSDFTNNPESRVMYVKIHCASWIFSLPCISPFLNGLLKTAICGVSEKSQTAYLQIHFQPKERQKTLSCDHGGVFIF